MEASICLSRPFDVFISSEVIKERNLTNDEVVKISLGEEHEIAAPFYPIEEFDLQQEGMAYFETLPNLSSDLPSKITDSFDSNCLDDEEEAIELNGPNEMESYIDNIRELNEKQFNNEEIIIGISIVDSLLQEPREGIFEGNLTAAPTGLILESLSDETYDVNIKEFENEIREPEKLVFCTHTHALSEEIYEDIKDYLDKLEYMASYCNYLIASPAGTFHGPLAKYEAEKEDMLKLTKENIKFNSIKWTALNAKDGDVNIDFDDLYNILEENLDYEDIEKGEEYERINVYFEGYYIELSDNENSVRIHIAHATDTEIDEIEAAINDLIPALEEKIGSKVELASIHTHTYRSPLLNDTWVLDTNTLYKQSSRSDSTDISNFIMHTKNIYNTKIRVPWQVICEVNRHKEESSSKRRISNQGIKNLRTLKIVSDFGYIDLDIERPPEKIDNSIIPDTGATDTGILASVPDNGTLLTNDQRLKEMANVYEIPVFDVVSQTSQDNAEISDIWESAKDILEDEYVLFDDFIDTVENIISGHEFSDIEEKTEDPEDLINNWVKNSDIIIFHYEEEKHVALSQEFDVVPTYKMVREVIDKAEGSGSDYLLTKEFLEEVRNRIGRLPQYKLPTISFVIPEQFVYRASEVDQLEELLKLSNLRNSRYKSTSVSVDQSALQTELNEAVIKTARMEDAIVLCGSDEQDLSMTSILIDVEVVEY